MGKVDNGQVTVFGVLAKDRFAVPVDVGLYLPMRISGRGLKSTSYRNGANRLEIKAIVDQMDLGSQPVLTLRDTTPGPLKVRALHITVYVWDGESSKGKTIFFGI